MAAVVEPVGRKANWSVNWSVGGGDSSAGYRYWRTTNRSMTRVKTGVMEMGRKSACCCGTGTFRIGRMQACFHWLGTVDVLRARLNSTAIGLLKTGAASLRYQAGRPSSPVAVGERLSRMRNTARR